MKTKRVEIGAAIGLIFLPIIVILGEKEIYQFIKFDTAYGQLLVDLGIFFIAWLLNHYLFQVHVYPFSTEKPVSQLLNFIPGIVMLGVTGKFMPLGTAKNVLLASVTVLMIAIAEEYTFRGLLIPVLGKLLKDRTFLILLISSLGFGSIHFINLLNHFPFYLIFAQVMLAAATGMLYGALYIKTHNLLLPIILHVITDLPTMFPHAGSGASSSKMPGNQLLVMVAITLGMFVACSIVAYFQTRKTKINF